MGYVHRLAQRLHLGVRRFRPRSDPGALPDLQGVSEEEHRRDQVENQLGGHPVMTQQPPGRHQRADEPRGQRQQVDGHDHQPDQPLHQRGQVPKDGHLGCGDGDQGDRQVRDHRAQPADRRRHVHGQRGLAPWRRRRPHRRAWAVVIDRPSSKRTLPMWVHGPCPPANIRMISTSATIRPVIMATRTQRGRSPVDAVLRGCRSVMSGSVPTSPLFYDTACIDLDALYRKTPYYEDVPKLWEQTVVEHRRAVGDAILDAASALAEQQGPRAMTMSQVAERAGIGRATLYKYFPDVDAILLAWQ